MSGRRLLIGILTMGLITPAILYFLLPLQSTSQFLSTALILISGWGVADFAANILSRPRLVNRSPKAALRDWDNEKS